MRDPYAGLAPLNDGMTGAHGIRAFYRQWLEALLRGAKDRGVTGSVLVDLACGTGNSTIPGSRKAGWTVVGVDLIGPRRRVLARRKSSAVRFVRQELTELKLDVRADFVTCHFDALTHILDSGDGTGVRTRCRDASTGRALPVRPQHRSHASVARGAGKTGPRRAPLVHGDHGVNYRKTGAGHVQPALVHQTGTPLRAAPRDRPDQGVQRRGDQAVAACRRPAAVSCGHAGAHRREADAEALPGAEVGGRPRTLTRGASVRPFRGPQRPTFRAQGSGSGLRALGARTQVVRAPESQEGASPADGLA